jgi:RNA polymerase sigma-70 factor (ECF subfamily)
MNDLNAIVKAHSDAVWRSVFRLLNNYEDALDCYQETFLAVLRLSPGEDVRHWRNLLLRIATCRAIDRLRQRYQSEKTACSLRQTASSQSPVEAPDARAQSQELQEHVRQALAALPDRQAEAFWLRHLEQLSPDEVAQLMGVEPGHVRVLVHRAAAGLRDLLGPSFGPPHLSERTP